jgi:hypothetical protein
LVEQTLRRFQTCRVVAYRQIAVTLICSNRRDCGEEHLEIHAAGIVMGAGLGWLLSLVSGNLFVVLMIGTLGLVVGGILGIVDRNDP